MKLYGIPNCDTVKKARVFLEEKGVAYEFVDFKKTPPDAALLETWLQSVPLETLLNKRGTTWRKLDAAVQAEAAEAAGAVRVMTENPSVIKRPVLEKDGCVYVGFSADQYAEIFG